MTPHKLNNIYRADLIPADETTTGPYSTTPKRFPVLS